MNMNKILQLIGQGSEFLYHLDIEKGFEVTIISNTD